MKSISYYISNPNKFFISVLNSLGYLIPDKKFLEIKYKLETGKKLDLENPETFQQKIQWLKLYDRRSEYIKMVDKLAVKEYVASIIGKKYIIPTIGVWDNFEDIDFSKLPEKFVLKTTHGGGSCGVVICKDKALFNIEEARNKINSSLSSDIYKNMREWPYKKVQKRIIAEKFIEFPNKEDLTDYKFFCFNGNPKFIQVIQDRKSKETIDFFDLDWNHQEFVGLNRKCQNALNIPDKPKNLSEMIEISEKLSKDKIFVRVDLYNINGQIYFGEITFYPTSGFGSFSPEEWNLRLGKLIELPYWNK